MKCVLCEKIHSFADHLKYHCRASRQRANLLANRNYKKPRDQCRFKLKSRSRSRSNRKRKRNRMSCNSSALIFEARLCVVASYSRRDALNAIAALLSLLIGFAAPGTAGTMRRVCESERVQGPAQTQLCLRADLRVLLGFVVKIRLLITLTPSHTLSLCPIRSLSVCVRLKLKVFVANQSY